jgi:hypothetical protein
MDNAGQLGAQPAAGSGLTYVFLVTREMWTDFFTIHLVDLKTGQPNGQTEELDPEETVKWFKERGADMPLLEKALDHCWNFLKVAVEISNYKEPPTRNAAVRPNID